MCARPTTPTCGPFSLQHDGKVTDGNDEGLTVSDLSAEEIGKIAFDVGIVVYELTPQRASLEDVFMDLTSDAVEYGSSGVRRES